MTFERVLVLSRTSLSGLQTSKLELLVTAQIILAVIPMNIPASLYSWSCLIQLNNFSHQIRVILFH